MSKIYDLALLLPCAVCLIGAVWFICKRESNTRSQNILVVVFVVSALLFLCTVNYISSSIDSTAYMWWDIIDSFASMLAIPTMYLYFHSKINENSFTWKEYIWFVPALFIGIGTAVLYVVMDKKEMDGYIQSVLIDGDKNSSYSGFIYQLHQFIGIELYNLTALVQIIGTSILAILGLKKYSKRLYEFYSDADDKSLYTDKKILHWFLITIPLSLVLILLDIKFWRDHPVLSAFFFIAWSVVYFVIFYFANQKMYTIDNLVQDLQRADLEEKIYCDVAAVELQKLNMSVCHIPPEVYQRLIIMFSKLIDEQKIYLKCSLRLDEVARLMFTNRAYVSKVIKEQYNCSFSDYINTKRINFSMRLMRTESNLTQDIIAEKSGFINAQSYSRTFKRMIGIPPKEWFNNHLK